MMKLRFVSLTGAALGCATLMACSDDGSGTRGSSISMDMDAAVSSPEDAGSDAADRGKTNTSDAAPVDAGLEDAEAKPKDASTSTRDAGSASQEDAGPAPSAFINPAPGSRLFLGANLWNIDWEGSENYFVPSTDWATTKNPWDSQFIQDLAPYHVLRFMDWNLTNAEDNPQADWATRKLPTADQTTSPVAFEWQIDLCNRTQKDYWVNIPHAASSDYMKKLAGLIRDKLDPRLRIYVEWSNEVWNGGFPQREYARSQGENLGLAGDDKGFAYQMYQSVRTFETFEAVFGKDKSRLVKVISGQAANWGVCELHIEALKDPKINPLGTMPDVYAVAPYFAGANLAELNDVGIPESATWVTDTYRCAKLANLKVVAYEGGQDSYLAAGGPGPCQTLQQQAGMRETYVSFLNAMKGADLAGPLMQYTHSGYCWGMKVNTSDANESSPKYQGMLDWLSQQD